MRGPGIGIASLTVVDIIGFVVLMRFVNVIEDLGLPGQPGVVFIIWSDFGIGFMVGLVVLLEEY